MKNRYIVKIYDGVLRRKSARTIHKELYDMTINKKVFDTKLLAMMIKVTNKAKKKDVGTAGLDVLAVALLDMFNKDRISDKADSIINDRLIRDESKEKDKILADVIKKGRKDKKIFYLASSHNDCAADHEAFQGKLYVDNQWWQLTHDEDVRDYIRSHNIKTMQWVTGRPVWFLTRPHCRHYFVQLSIDDVLGHSLESLKKKNHTHTKIGDREYQTDAKMTLEKYEERLRLLKSLYSVYKTDKLRNQILKTEILIKKWKKYLDIK